MTFREKYLLDIGILFFSLFSPENLQTVELYLPLPAKVGSSSSASIHDSESKVTMANVPTNLGMTSFSLFFTISETSNKAHSPRLMRASIQVNLEVSL